MIQSANNIWASSKEELTAMFKISNILLDKIEFKPFHTYRFKVWYDDEVYDKDFGELGRDATEITVEYEEDNTYSLTNNNKLCYRDVIINPQPSLRKAYNIGMQHRSVRKYVRRLVKNKRQEIADMNYHIWANELIKNLVPISTVSVNVRTPISLYDYTSNAVEKDIMRTVKSYRGKPFNEIFTSCRGMSMSEAYHCIRKKPHLKVIEEDINSFIVFDENVRAYNPVITEDFDDFGQIVDAQFINVEQVDKGNIVILTSSKEVTTYKDFNGNLWEEYHEGIPFVKKIYKL